MLASCPPCEHIVMVEQTETRMMARRLARAQQARGFLSCALLLAIVVLATGCRPAVPVILSHRPAVMGEGLVAKFSNQTSSQITVLVRVKRPDGDEYFERSVNVPANGSAELGWAEGWDFELGDKITLTHPKYAAAVWYLQ